MNTYTYTDQILLSLDKREPQTVSQLATQISHDAGKTRHIVVLMASNNKIAKGGSLDGETSYRLTALGRAIVARLHGGDQAEPLTHQRREDSEPVIRPLTPEPTPVPAKRGRKAKVAPAATLETPYLPAPAASTAAEIVSHLTTAPPPARPLGTARVGILNTGELIVLETDQPTIVISAPAAKAILEYATLQVRA